MINAVGLQGPGVARWLADDLPACSTTAPRSWPASGVARSTTTARAAELLAGAPDGVVAVEVNLSCPNLEGRGGIFAHDPELSAEVIAATAAAAGRDGPSSAPTPTASSRSPRPCTAAGAEAVTLINTLLGMVIDPTTRQPALGAGGGGCRGRAIHPVAVRAVYDVHAALPDLPIVGVGGVAERVGRGRADARRGRTRCRSAPPLRSTDARAGARAVEDWCDDTAWQLGRQVGGHPNDWRA